MWSSVSLSCVWKAEGRCRSPNSCRRNRCSTLLPINGERALAPQVLKPLIRTTGTPIPLFIFWNDGNTRAVRLISRPTPTPSGTRSSGKRPLRSRRYSTTPIRLSLSRKSLTRCRKSASSATEGQKQEKAACSPAWFTVLIAGQKCATAPPTTLRSGKTILYAPATAATREPVQLTSSGRLYWKNWSGCT